MRPRQTPAGPRHTHVTTHSSQTATTQKWTTAHDKAVPHPGLIQHDQHALSRACKRSGAGHEAATNAPSTLLRHSRHCPLISNPAAHQPAPPTAVDRPPPQLDRTPLIRELPPQPRCRAPLQPPQSVALPHRHPQRPERSQSLPARSVRLAASLPRCQMPLRPARPQRLRLSASSHTRT